MPIIPQNLFSLESGINLQTQITNINVWSGSSTGIYYPLTGNPSGFLTSATLGGVNFITATGTVNSGVASGNVVFTGIGNITVSTGINKSIVISGNTGAYSNFITSSQTGALTGQFYPLTGNPSGFVTSTSGVVNVQGSATILDGQLLIGTSGLNAFIQGNVYGVSGIITQSGSGQLIISTDSSIVKTNQTGGFSSVQVTGSSLLPLINLTGAGNVSVTTGASGIVNISGNTGAYSNFLTNITGTSEIWIAAGAMTPGITNGAITGIISTGGMIFDVLDFKQSGVISAYFNLNFPMIWNTSTVKGRFHWTETGVTGTTGTVVWGLDGIAIKDNDVFDLGFGTGQQVTGVSATGLRMHTATTPSLLISGATGSALDCFFKVYRYSGSLSGDARLVGLSLQYYHTGTNIINF